jgi:hypothetical protein
VDSMSQFLQWSWDNYTPPFSDLCLPKMIMSEI